MKPPKPPLQLSLQFADATTARAQLPRHRVARWVRAALARRARSRCASWATMKGGR
jgi:hypothetical protein